VPIVTGEEALLARGLTRRLDTVPVGARIPNWSCSPGTVRAEARRLAWRVAVGPDGRPEDGKRAYIDAWGRRVLHAEPLVSGTEKLRIHDCHLSKDRDDFEILTGPAAHRPRLRLQAALLSDARRHRRHLRDVVRAVQPDGFEQAALRGQHLLSGRLQRERSTRRGRREDVLCRGHERSGRISHEIRTRVHDDEMDGFSRGRPGQVRAPGDMNDLWVEAYTGVQDWETTYDCSGFIARSLPRTPRSIRS